MDFYHQYFKYKAKYIHLKNKFNSIDQDGGGKYKKSKKQKKDLQKRIFPNSVRFTPEIEPQYLPYEQHKEQFEKLFPPTDTKHKLQLSNIGEYSVSTPEVAENITQIIKSYFPKDRKITITEANGNMGGNTINFAKHFDHVHAVEILKLHVDILKNNIAQYPHTKGKVTIHHADYLDKISELEQDVVFFDPPWGGTDYKKNQSLDLELNKVHMGDIINYLLDKAEVIAMQVPRNFNFNKLYQKLHGESINVHKVFYPKLEKKKHRIVAYYMIIVSRHALVRFIHED